MTQLKKVVRLNADDFALCCGVVGGIFLLLQIVMGIVIATIKPDTSVMIAGMVLLIGAGVMIFLVSMSQVMISFPMALTFGQTRRRALGQTLGLAGVETLCTMVLAGLLTAAERAFAPKLWLLLSGKQAVTVGEIMPTPEPGLGASADLAREFVLVVEPFSVPWWVFPLVALAALAAGVITGAVLQRFGGKGGWALWAVWMAACFAPQLLPWKQYTILDWLIPLTVVLLLAALIWSVWSLLHAVVKS